MLANNPSVILADEPTGSVDSATGQSICRLLKELGEEQGRTIVVVTHEPAVAIWARRVVMLKDGRNLVEFNTNELGDAQSLAARYLDVVRAALPVEQRS
jgi:putative ABC transport system ATP-binding protein